MRVFVTGGCGFIGTNLIISLLSSGHTVLNFDKLTYASSQCLRNKYSQTEKYIFVHGDICDKRLLESTITNFMPDIILHLAAESHVDRSIETAKSFVESNIIGTYNLVEIVKQYYNSLHTEKQESFKLIGVSTDEVFGDLGELDDPFTEESQYRPSSPYSASKASSDHLLSAWRRTYGLPIIITNCSNNFGPYQHHEKLIPKVIKNVMQGNKVPIYGDGKNKRDWLYVEDHVRALCILAESNIRVGNYLIGGNNEWNNLDIVNLIFDIIDNLDVSTLRRADLSKLIEFVDDRMGHDHRYAIDASKLKSQTGWTPLRSFQCALEETVTHYVYLYKNSVEGFVK